MMFFRGCPISYIKESRSGIIRRVRLRNGFDCTKTDFPSRKEIYEICEKMTDREALEFVEKMFPK